MPRRLTRARLRSKASRVRARLRLRAWYASMAIRLPESARDQESPSNFAAWAARRIRPGVVLDAWAQDQQVPIATPARVGVVVHVYYTDLLSDLIRRLAAIPVAFDLIITNSSGESLNVDRSLLPRAMNILELEVENRGRDLWPLAQIVNAGLLDPYHLILKVHTKRSEWRDSHGGFPGTGAEWRDELLEAVLGDAERITALLEAFATNSRLGLVTADGSVRGPESWGFNEATTAGLLRRLQLDLRPQELVFPAGSMYWVRGFVLQGLRALCLSAEDFEDEAGHRDGTTAHALERLIGVVTEEAGLSIVERSRLPHEPAGAETWHRFEPTAGLRPRVRVVPFYLPQFHPIPENNRWWGAGFTEWSNVAAARPVFVGHHQPKLPTTTGFYDLRLHETVALQAALARDVGIDGFMYYHYWFAGHQLLERPINSRLDDDIQLPFCLMWANENWTRRWDGHINDVLLGQDYERVPSSQFITDVLPILRDPRYLRIDGRALIAIYRPGQIPDLAAVIAEWRETARREGVGELVVLTVDVPRGFHGLEDEAESIGLDGSLGFPPHRSHWEPAPLERLAGLQPGFEGRILSYRATVDKAIASLALSLPDTYFPGVMVNFDNTARRPASPDLWYGSNPYTFRRWLAAAAAAVAHRAPERRVVFINAWNEWAEGAVLEPNDRQGPTFLLAVRDVVYS
jgi:lipopolysaccharide biosynthesis protein